MVEGEGGGGKIVESMEGVVLHFHEKVIVPSETLDSGLQRLRTMIARASVS